MNILILEDDENQSAGLSQYLKEYEKDFHIYMEKDYDSAKKRAFHVPIDLFFLDIELEKEKNGLDFGMILLSGTAGIKYTCNLLICPLRLCIFGFK